MSVRVPDRDAMHAFGAELATVLRAGDLVVLTGPLGAGKTTLTQGIARGLGVRGDVTSPTFVIARVHPSTVEGPALVHADAYRLGSALELDDLDLDASLDESVTVVEWGEGIAEVLSADRLEVVIERVLGADGTGDAAATDGTDEGTAVEVRTVTVHGHGPRWAGLRLPAG